MVIDRHTKTCRPVLPLQMSLGILGLPDSEAPPRSIRRRGGTAPFKQILCRLSESIEASSPAEQVVCQLRYTFALVMLSYTTYMNMQ